MAKTSQPRLRGGRYSDSLGHGSFSTTETMVAELEAPPELPERRRPTPRHPILSMQEAFAESLEEATIGTVVQKPQLRAGNAKFRREALLDQDKNDGPPEQLWRFRPRQRCHELRRLVAQISFGVYLLLEGMANNKVDVITILQGHIDEVDEFLETTLEDMALATTDLKDRLQHLRLPMENMDIFEKMLEDRNFRLQIVTGNEMIEHIVSRTTTALLQTEQDVIQGITSTREFSTYLAKQQHASWRRERPDVGPIYEAMKGNTEGWYNAFMELQAQGASLNALIVKLNVVVDEMERRAGEVSRRIRFSIQPYTGPAAAQQQHHTPRSSQSSTSTTVTPADSPPSRISDAPPRLSLRLSSIIKSRTSISSYFDLSGKRDRRDTASSFLAKEIVLEPAVLEEELEAEPEPVQGPVHEPVHEPVYEPVHQPVHEPVHELAHEPPLNPEFEAESEIIVQPDEKLEEQAEEEQLEEEPQEEPLLLQAKAYQSPRFLPPRSPRSPALSNERQRSYESESQRETERRRISPVVPRVSSVVPQLEASLSDEEEEKETAEGEGAGQDAPLFILQPRTYTPQPASPLSSPRPPPSRVASPRVQPSRPSSSRVGSPRVSSARYDDAPAQPSRMPPSPNTAQAQARVDAEAESQPKQRTSLRQRLSLKTTPPQSTQVPPPRARERQQQQQQEQYRTPVHLSPRTYQGPDTAYASDVDQQQINSYISMDPASVPVPPTPEFRRPVLIPSPHSDQQFFRPVQASPHSPLQQRPHTSHTVTPRHLTYQQQHQRNVPSRMGMSMVSNVTTATNETSQTLKKKRSAFGWLKKAFSLDEEERAAFEQKRREEAPPNPYHDARSPKFLDGKRIR